MCSGWAPVQPCPRAVTERNRKRFCFLPVQPGNRMGEMKPPSLPHIPPPQAYWIRVGGRVEPGLQGKGVPVPPPSHPSLFRAAAHSHACLFSAPLTRGQEGGGMEPPCCKTPPLRWLRSWGCKVGSSCQGAPFPQPQFLVQQKTLHSSKLQPKENSGGGRDNGAPLLCGPAHSPSSPRSKPASWWGAHNIGGFILPLSPAAADSRQLCGGAGCGEEPFKQPPERWANKSGCFRVPTPQGLTSFLSTPALI